MRPRSGAYVLLSRQVIRHRARLFVMIYIGQEGVLRLDSPVNTTS